MTKNEIEFFDILISILREVTPWMGVLAQLLRNHERFITVFTRLHLCTLPSPQRVGSSPLEQRFLTF
jgi:hypothetical protein